VVSVAPAAPIAPARRGAVVLLFAVLVVASLSAGIAGGLMRAGFAVSPAPGALAGNALLHHAALMLGGFFATVIGIERAVALKARAAFAAPLASGFAGVLLLAGQAALAAMVLVIAALAFVAVNGAIVRRQAAAHTRLLLFAALAWLAGNALFAAGGADMAVFAWWFLFITATIAAERLELTRLTPRPAQAQPMLFAVLAAGVAGAVLSSVSALAGGVLYGVALTALAAWFGAYDIARRTLFTRGLSRYMAVCLLGGYGWLAVAGICWATNALGFPARDPALHALGLGFIVSMVMAHALVILPAVTRIRLDFTPVFYAPVALLHASLVLRLASETTHTTGAALNAAALAVFALTVAGSALRKRFRHTPTVR
jgi:hypothetical protein